MKYSFCLILAFMVVVLQPAKAQQSNVKCFPSEWWTGMQYNKLLLTFFGHEMALNNVSVDYGGVSIIRQFPGENKSYLFVEIEISPSASAGTIPIRFTRANRNVATHNFRLLSRATPHTVSKLNSSDIIYQIVPDRFINSDMSNDNIQGFYERMDRMNPSGIHGGDIQGITHAANYLEQLGVTAIELTPLYESNQLVLSYERFAPTNHFAMDPRLGSLVHLNNLISVYRSKNIKVILTMVLHKIGNQHPFGLNPPFQDWIPPRAAHTSDGSNFTVFADPYASKEDYRRHTLAWEAFDTPSLNHENKELRRYLIQHVIWWIETTKPDAIKIEKTHQNHPLLLHELTSAIIQDYPELNIISAPETATAALNQYWLKGDTLPFYFTHVTDMPLYNAWEDVFTEFRRSDAILNNIYQTFASDRVYKTDVADQLIFYGDRHNSTRLFTLAEKDLNLFKMYMGFLLTVRGIPGFLYGTEVLMEGYAPEGNGFVRGGFPGGWPGDQVNAMNRATLSTNQREAVDYIRNLLSWRKNNPELMQGRTIQFEPTNHVYAFFRTSNNKKLMVLINNHPDAPRRIEPSRFAETLGPIGQTLNVVTGETASGLGNLILNPKGILILEIQNR